MRALGPYRLISRIGIGSTSTVWKAIEPGTSDIVAVKVLRARPGDLFSTELERFRKEMHIHTGLSHPNIVKMLNHGVDENRAWAAMEWVDGPSLQDVLNHTEGPLPPSFVLETAYRIARALSHAHGQRDENGTPAPVVHRDIKPGNIAIGASKGLKLLDFGMARWAASERQTTDMFTLKGTPLYMSPEQIAEPTHVGPASDIFSLGTLMLEMLSGRNPWFARSPQLLMRKIMFYEPMAELDAIGERTPLLAELLRTMIAKEVRDRAVDAGLVVTFLERMRRRHPLSGTLAAEAGRLTREGLTKARTGLGPVDLTTWTRLKAVQPEDGLKSTIRLRSTPFGAPTAREA